MLSLQLAVCSHADISIQLKALLYTLTEPLACWLLVLFQCVCALQSFFSIQQGPCVNSVVTFRGHGTAWVRHCCIDRTLRWPLMFLAVQLHLWDQSAITGPYFVHATTLPPYQQGKLWDTPPESCPVAECLDVRNIVRHSSQELLHTH